MDNSTLGIRLRTVRKASGLSQTHLARTLGFQHESSISKIEAGARGLSALELGQWANECGVSVSDLLSDKPLVVRIGTETAVNE